MENSNVIVSDMFIKQYINTLEKQFLWKVVDDESLFSDSKYHKIQLYLDIFKKIDGVDCQMFIEIFRDGDTYLSIKRNRKPQNILIYDNFRDQMNFDRNDSDDDSDSDFSISINQMKQILKKIKWSDIINTIINFKYNSVLDKFVEYDVSEEELKNIGYEFSDCCICYEPTTYRDINNHHICRVCFDKLKTRKCPLCRIVLNKESCNLFECVCCHI